MQRLKISFYMPYSKLHAPNMDSGSKDYIILLLCIYILDIEFIFISISL